MDEVLKHYNIDKLVVPAECIQHGWMNISHKLTTESGRCYVLRQYVSNERRTPSPESISFELDYMKYLFRNGLPVPKIISPSVDEESLKDDGCLIHYGGKYYVLFEFINGIHYRNPEFNERQLWQVINVAQFLGQMHRLTMNSNEYKLKLQSSGRIPLNFIQIKYDLMAKCEKFKLQQPALNKRVENLINKQTSMIPLTSDEQEQVIFVTKFEETLPKALIHADFQQLNVLFNSEMKTIAGVLDFDGIYYGPLLVDFGLAVTQWCYEGKKLNEEWLQIFLYEYQQKRQMNLTEDEWNKLFLYCFLRNTHSLLFTINAYETQIERNTRGLFLIGQWLDVMEYLSQLNEKELIQRIRDIMAIKDNGL